jgi:hypothetical protein
MLVGMSRSSPPLARRTSLGFTDAARLAGMITASTAAKTSAPMAIHTDSGSTVLVFRFG